MKKILFTLTLLICARSAALAIIILPSIQQTQYRWRNDDGNEATATWNAAANTPLTITNASATQRLRLEFRNTSGATAVVDQTLEYSSNGGTNWTPITNAPANEFWYQASTLAPNGTATTNQMGAATAGIYVAGKVVSAPAVATSLATASRTEYEWVIKPTGNIQPFATYIFRSANQGSTPINYGKLSTGCVGTIVAGNLDAGVPLVNCAGTTSLTLTDHTVGAVNFRWQQNSGAGWVDFGPNSDNTVTPPVIQTSAFRCIVSCAASASNADTSEEVTVAALPLLVDLGSDINKCISADESIVLDAGVFPGTIQYVWSNGATGQVNSVNQSGIYIVRVTDQFTCTGADTIKVTLRQNPKLDLGEDTSICNGGTLVLDAGNDGIDYYWNSSETTRTIVADHPGMYVAFVTNDEGCTVSDTFNLSYSGEFPRIQGITVTNNGFRTFYFTAVNPQNVIGLDWDFGDGSEHSFAPVPTHTYPDDDNYIVVLRMASTCGFRSDSTSVHILGINQLNVDNKEIGIFPNPAKTSATILNQGKLKMKEVVVYNLSGQIVYKAKADAGNKHVLHLNDNASGLYTIGIITDQGVVIRKLELLK